MSYDIVSEMLPAPIVDEPVDELHRGETDFVLGRVDSGAGAGL